MKESILKNITNELKKEVSKDRFRHTTEVAEAAVKLAKIHKIDPKKAAVAAYMHDYCREWSQEKADEYIDVNNLDPGGETNILLSHGHLASHLASEKFGVKDKEVLGAIKNHTLGAPQMSDLERIVFISDFIASTKGLDISKDVYKLAKDSLLDATLAVYEKTYDFLKGKNFVISKTFLKNWEANKV